jgi:hypothetical protein
MGKSVNKSTNPYICPPVTSWSIFRREKRVIFDVGAKQNQRQRGASGGKEEEGGRRKEEGGRSSLGQQTPTLITQLLAQTRQLFLCTSLCFLTSLAMSSFLKFRLPACPLS